MVTSLFAEIAIPAWDRQLVDGLKDVVLGMVDWEPTRHITVRNDGGEFYRMVVANGPEQQDALLECFARRGFESAADGDRTVRTLSHVRAALQIPEPGSKGAASDSGFLVLHEFGHGRPLYFKVVIARPEPLVRDGFQHPALPIVSAAAS